MRRLLSTISAILLISLHILAQTADSRRARLLMDVISKYEVPQYISNELAINIGTELNELLSIYRQAYGSDSPQYADALLQAALTCADFGDNKQGMKWVKRSDEIFKQHGHGPFDGRDTVQQIFRMDICSHLYYNSSAETRAISLSQQSLQLKKEYFGEHSEVYLNELLNISRLYAERLNYSKSNIYHNLGYQAYVELLKQEFCSTSESERTLYWEKAIKYIDKTLQLAYKAGSKGQRGGSQSLAAAAYNAMLLSKGLLLNTTVGFETYINQSGNVEAMRNLQLKKQLADQQAEQSVLDSLDYVILNALQQAGQSFQLPHLSISWTDVAQKLEAGDLAVEFFKTADGKYGALLLKHDWTSPKIVRLNEFVNMGKKYLDLASAIGTISLEHYEPAQAQQLWSLSKSIWTDDIVRYFPANGEGRIFFAADGELLMTGIEYLPFIEPEGNGSFTCIADLFNLYRLSSTRELVMTSTTPSSNDMAVYGGLRYDMFDDELLADAQQYRTATDLAYSPTQRLRDVRAADRAIPYLEGTALEADSIVAAINGSTSNSLTARPYIGNSGTEASFKALSGRHNRVIHVATHGFFYSDNDSTFNRFELGNNPLVRSGLFFSGADNKWFGIDLPDDVDDGFLTSLEISNLNFQGLDLIVLSACETGRGDIKGDGVFGLQRGFKMASANSIMMSLWKVDDDATCLLMTEFYRHWLGGQSKRAALESARQAVRSHTEKGWDNPNYWASFILLDALD
ncbi:MAG: CHAT domain-containing protein [Bacteroidaceae bacterium]|nr:CHAT domain-containing protein [Bacteroidaceae bacterium]